MDALVALAPADTRKALMAASALLSGPFDDRKWLPAEQKDGKRWRRDGLSMHRLEKIV